MKNKIYARKRLSFTTKFILITVGLVSSFIACRKGEQAGPLVEQNGDKESMKLVAAAKKALKSHATQSKFEDIDWANAKVTNFNGVPYLLKVPSKSDKDKFLFYNRTSGVIHARWVQFGAKRGTASSSIAVTSIKETVKKEFSFDKGRMISARLNGAAVSLADTANHKINNLTMPPLKLKSMSFDGQESGDGDGGWDGGDGGGSGDGSNGVGVVWDLGTLPEVTVTSTSNNSSVTLYSLYLLLGNNAAYANQYTTDPSHDGGTYTGATSSVITLAAKGDSFGYDGDFKKNATDAIPIFKNTGGIAIGYTISFHYIKGANGSLSISNLNCALGGTTLGNSFTVLSSGFTVSGPVVNFTVTGTTNYNLFLEGIGTINADPTKVTGTYNTSDGTWTMSIR